MNALRACPFCGEINDIEVSTGEDWSGSPLDRYVVCRCRACGPNVEARSRAPQDLQQAAVAAVAAWNKRSP